MVRRPPSPWSERFAISLLVDFLASSLSRLSFPFPIGISVDGAAVMSYSHRSLQRLDGIGRHPSIGLHAEGSVAVAHYCRAIHWDAYDEWKAETREKGYFSTAQSVG